MLIDHICVTIENGTIDENKIRYYIQQIKKYSHGKRLKSLELFIGNEFIDMRYSFHNFPLERIRRINTMLEISNEKRVV